MSSEEPGLREVTEWTLNVQGVKGQLPSLKELIGESHQGMSDSQFRDFVQHWSAIHAGSIEKTECLACESRRQRVCGYAVGVGAVLVILLAMMVWVMGSLSRQESELSQLRRDVVWYGRWVREAADVYVVPPVVWDVVVDPSDTGGRQVFIVGD